MGDLWVHLGPWLILAALVPAVVVLSLRVMPTDDWAEGVIRGWAEREGMQIAKIEPVEWFGLRRRSQFHVVYRVGVIDPGGGERSCRAVVGHWLLRRTCRNLLITWIQPR